MSAERLGLRRHAHRQHGKWPWQGAEASPAGLLPAPLPDCRKAACSRSRCRVLQHATQDAETHASWSQARPVKNGHAATQAKTCLATQRPASRPAARPKPLFPASRHAGRFRTQAGACRHHPSPLPPCALSLGHGAGKSCRSAFRAPKTEEGARPLDARPLPKGRLGKGFRAPLDPDGAFLVPHLDLGCQRRPSGRREGWKAVLRQSGQARQSLQNP